MNARFTRKFTLGPEDLHKGSCLAPSPVSRWSTDTAKPRAAGIKPLLLRGLWMSLTRSVLLCLAVLALLATACGQVNSNGHDAPPSSGSTPCVLDQSKIDNCTL